MEYLVYKHTSPSGKAYIGITNNYDRRSSDHQYLSHTNKSSCRAFAAAVRKYGWDAFLHEELANGLTLEEANERETLCITEHGTLAPYGYNLTTGGGVTKLSPETRALISEANRRRVCSEVTREKQASHKRGKVPSIETRQKMSQSRLGNSWSSDRKKPKRQCIITDPHGNVHVVIGLKPFCDQHNLTHSCMLAVANGKSRSYKGWTCKYTDM